MRRSIHARPFGTLRRALFLAAVVAALFCPSSSSAQGGLDSIPRYRFDAILVTATRSPKPAFLTPAPVAFIDSARLARVRPNTMTDVFRELPGLDVTGVGVQQPRPIIRGQRGQRILLLQDGMRLNNSRRQQDFGEVPALIDVSAIERVEVVRGPASVLYGTDAIGGVVNIITRRADREGLHGRAGYRFGDAGDQHKGDFTLLGGSGAIDFLLGGSVREAGSYTAPEGEFGNITLDSDATVQRTGVRDRSLQGSIGYAIGEGQRVFLRGEGYRANDAGFGFVDPADYAPQLPHIEILYPTQRFAKFTAGYSATGLGTVVAEAVEVSAYVQDNERELSFDLFQSFGPQAPQGAGVAVKTFNFTDLRTLGLRVEARKIAAQRLLLTYGVDAFRDRSDNSDSSRTTVTGFGPPQTTVSRTPLVPNATYRSLGAFLQGELTFTPRLTLTLGGRFQHIRAETEETSGIPQTFEARTNRTVVGAANVLYRVADRVSLIGSVGRAFRSPNLIEWFFDGPTPEGNGYQLRSPDLEPETSLNVDLGIRYRSPRVYAEAFGFQNRVSNGIRIAPTGTRVGVLPAFQNVNVEKLVFRGVELSGEVAVLTPLWVFGGYTRIDSEDRLDPSNPIGDSFSSKLTAGLRYQDPSDRFWAESVVRHNGERKEVLLEENPVGDVLPSFTVLGVRAGATVFRRGDHAHRVTVGVENLTNELYAESSNVSFFRPEPRRSLVLSWDVVF
jgi:outer membrane receptor protein involved in Fe transport